MKRATIPDVTEAPATDWLVTAEAGSAADVWATEYLLADVETAELLAEAAALLADVDGLAEALAA